MTDDELRAEYLKRTGAALFDDKAAAWAWLWFSIEWRKLHREAVGVFLLLGQRPKAAGLANILRFVARAREPRDFFESLRSETGDAYAEALAGAEIVRTARPPGYDDLTKRIALEGVKACLPLVGLDDSDPRAHSKIANAASTVWLHFVDAYHALQGLEPVAELHAGGAVDVMSNEEREKLEADDFLEFEIVDEIERAELERLVGLEIVAVDAGRV